MIVTVQTELIHVQRLAAMSVCTTALTDAHELKYDILGRYNSKTRDSYSCCNRG